MASHDLDMTSIEAAAAWSESFIEAKDKFEKAASDAGFTVMRQPLPMATDSRDSLEWEESADFASHMHISLAYRRGADLDAGAVPDSLLVLQSGVHGVEGFFGSAVQTAALRNIAAGRMPHLLPGRRDMVLFVHCVNPFGMAMGRRYNELGVDLNRAAIDEDAFRQLIAAGIPRAYRTVYDIANPPFLPSDGCCEQSCLNLAIARTICCQGFSQVKAGLATGHYVEPHTVQYGGAGLQPSCRALIDALAAVGVLAALEDSPAEAGDVAVAGAAAGDGTPGDAKAPPAALPTAAPAGGGGGEQALVAASAAGGASGASKAGRASARGGGEPSWPPEAAVGVAALFMGRRGPRRVVMVDCHTGLGAPAQNSILVADARSAARARALLGVSPDEVALPGTKRVVQCPEETGGAGVAYRIIGDMKQLYQCLPGPKGYPRHEGAGEAIGAAAARAQAFDGVAPGDRLVVSQEMGTVRATTVAKALRADCALSRHFPPGPGRGGVVPREHPIRAEVRRCFNPPSLEWRLSVLESGLTLLSAMADEFHDGASSE
ncbi:hypothetical protein FNF31_01649 [Cafeteria roenbergensis]|uniref:DUF2817 domain-containing protein n=1 Tax=Cafeteria roenbergensis TaxID=33653 RepID=A0A5A8DKW0_CAFRO|nr:hypothetical protein FNF28_06718 [Cafeteria roenbergensis]KAA0166036.1 hypothetical protein FNF31_01649 [Cafeteria roenbergensis]